MATASRKLCYLKKTDNALELTGCRADRDTRFN